MATAKWLRFAALLLLLASLAGVVGSVMLGTVRLMFSATFIVIAALAFLATRNPFSFRCWITFAAFAYLALADCVGWAANGHVAIAEPSQFGRLDLVPGLVVGAIGIATIWWSGTARYMRHREVRINGYALMTGAAELTGGIAAAVLASMR